MLASRRLARVLACAVAPGADHPPLEAETVALIRRMASENPLWGAGRIRSELLTPDIRVAKHSLQTYLLRAVPVRSRIHHTYQRAD